MIRGDREMGRKTHGGCRKAGRFAAAFLVVNVLAVLFIGVREKETIYRRMEQRADETGTAFEEVMENYQHSFRLFVELMGNEIRNNPDPDAIWDFLQNIDPVLLDIEGETFDGLYMYYKGRYLYSWDTPYSQYEETGYVATERPWYRDAAAGKGEIVFTPPYMSYANHYILTTLSQLQPDGETVFAYDIKMGDIQKLVSSMQKYENEQIIIFDRNGTVIGSTNPDYLGGDFYASTEEVEQAVKNVRAEMENIKQDDSEQLEKLEEQFHSAGAFLDFRRDFDKDFKTLKEENGKMIPVTVDGRRHFGMLAGENDYSFLILVPVNGMMGASLGSWLVPLLLVELLLIYILGHISREQKNRELKKAYIELGQTQKRLEIALNAAQKAAAIDDLTGLMNFKSFRSGVEEHLASMEVDEKGILIMIDGDHFKQVNDNYGHGTGDEVIKLSAQMIIGRIRFIDLASRLHGDEFAIFVSNTSDYSVAKGIIDDINRSIDKEAEKRGLPSITLSAGAVIAGNDDNYHALAKAADEALYEAKKTHDGGFAHV